MRKDKTKDTSNSEEAIPPPRGLANRPIVSPTLEAEKPIVRGKIRTRGHVLSDLSINFVERQAILCTFSVERVLHDYGIDLVMYTYNVRGEIESGQILFQVKATEHIRIIREKDSVLFSLEKSDLRLWLSEPNPVILAVYDGSSDLAYWLYIQAYFEGNGIDLSTLSTRIAVHIPLANLLNIEAIGKFAKYRDDVLAQAFRRILHRA